MKKSINIVIFILYNILSVAMADVSYIYDQDQQYSIENIQDAEFIQFNQTINNGLNNGIYWLKITNELKFEQIVQISNNHIKNVQAYSNGKVVETIPSYRFTTIKLYANNPTMYIKVLASKAAYIPVNFYTESAFLKHEQWQSTLMGLFYGFALMVIIVNVFYYFNFHDNSFLYYALFLFFVSLTLSYRDGFLHLVGMPNSVLQYTENIIHSFAGLTGAIFAIDYLQLKCNYPKFRSTLYFVVIGSFLFDILYFFTNDFRYFLASDFFTYYVFIGCWIASIFLFKRNNYAVYFCIAYSLMVILVFAFFLSPAIGVWNFGVDANLIKIGGYFEMLIITYAVVYRMGILQTENDQMGDEILNYTKQVESLSQELKKNQKGVKNYFTQFDLSLRENEILELLTQNKSNKEIANALVVSTNTVKYHIKNIYQKLQIKSRKEVHSIVNNH